MPFPPLLRVLRSKWSRLEQEATVNRQRSNFRRMLRVAPVLALLFASTAGAVVLPFTGTFQVEIGDIVTGFPISGSATVNGSGGGVHIVSLSLGAGQFSTTALTTTVTATSQFPIRGLQLTLANGAGAFAGTGMGELNGVMPLLGTAKVCLFGTCGAAVANLSVPLTVIGSGGLAVVSGPVNVTVAGAPWTTGTASVQLPFFPTIVTRMGFAHGPASHTGSTAAPSGSLALVTPIYVSTNISADQPVVFGFATLTMHFVPEPSTLVLGACGLALLVAAGRRRWL